MFEPTTLAAIVGVFLTAGSLMAIALQIRDSRRLAKAQFVSNLESDLAGHYRTYSKLLPGEPWSSLCKGPETSNETSDIIAYLGFFAKIKFLLDLGALDLNLVNRMFTFRFYLAAHNRHVQEKILYSSLYCQYWAEIFSLHSQWSSFRVSKGLPIPFEDESLDKVDPGKYKKIVDGWRAQSSSLNIFLRTWMRLSRQNFSHRIRMQAPPQESRHPEDQTADGEEDGEPDEPFLAGESAYSEERDRDA